MRRGYDLHLVFRPLLAHDRRRHDVAPAPRDRPRDRPAGARRAARTSWRRWSTTCSPRSADWDTMCAPRSPTSPTGSRSSPPPTEAPDDVAEAATFLDWLADDHFTFVGAVRVDADGVVVAGSELGVARRRPLVRDGAMVDGGAPWMLALTKALARSTVHRDVPLDCVNVRRLDADGSFLRRAAVRSASTPPTSTASRPRRSRCCARRWPQVVERSGFAADEPRRAHAGVTCSRATRATSCSASRVDELAELATGDRAHGAAPAGPPLREPRPARLLRVVPRVPPARPLHDAGAACRCSRRCATRVRRERRRLQPAAHRVGDGAAARRGEHARRRPHARSARGRGRAGGARARAGSTTSTTRSSPHVGEEAGVDAYRSWRDAFPAAYQYEVDAARRRRRRRRARATSSPAATSPSGWSRRRRRPRRPDQAVPRPVARSCCPTSCRCSSTSA